jgi:hypothetical protein
MRKKNRAAACHSRTNKVMVSGTSWSPIPKHFGTTTHENRSTKGTRTRS